MSALLENAVLSIQLGLEDFASADGRRVISAARNLHAGVLLLCKEALRLLSPPNSNDVLIKKKKKAVKGANGEVTFVGDGNKTIDHFEIEEAFRQLQLSVDLSNLKRLTDIRNDIEHMHPKHAPALIQEAMADAMPIIRDLVVKELQEEPSALLGQPAWDALLNEARVFKEEQEACRKSFDGVNWDSEVLKNAIADFQCPACSSSLLRNENDAELNPEGLTLICSKCGEEANTEDVIEAALQESLGPEDYRSIGDGGDSVIDDCPECGRDTYVFSEGRCLMPGCGFSLEGYECAVCSEPLTLDDYRYGDAKFCGYHAHVLSKDD